ncbi:MAG: hypothetical protein PUJ28_02270 [Prevotellaceae bacterium]|nr:hypothetical protein [Prevotellaceae bacterium]
MEVQNLHNNNEGAYSAGCAPFFISLRGKLKNRNKNRESRFASARNAGLRVANQDGKKRGANYDAKRNKKTGLQYCNG